MIEIKERVRLQEELKNFIVNVGWTHKIQITQSDFYTRDSKIAKYAKITFAALTSAGLGSFLLKLSSGFHEIALIITFVLSLATTFISLFSKEEDFEKLSDSFRISANKFLELREKATELLYQAKYNEELGNLSEKFMKMKELRLEYSSELLNPSKRARKIAEKRIKENRDNDYYEDYNFFIPKKLLEDDEVSNDN